MRKAAVTIVFAVAAVLVAGPSEAGTSEENSLFGTINARRDARGLRVLRENPVILAQARDHSADMAARNEMGHFGFEQRFVRIRNADGGVTWICENVAYARGYTDEQSLRVIYRAWRDSAPHRRCMFDRLGHRTQSGAVGLKKSGATWWATFIAARDRTP